MWQHLVSMPTCGSLRPGWHVPGPQCSRLLLEPPLLIWAAHKYRNLAFNVHKQWATASGLPTCIRFFQTLHEASFLHQQHGPSPFYILRSSGDVIGGLITATVGNAAELILSCIALRKSRVDLVQASLVGSMLSSLVLMTGLWS